MSRLIIWSGMMLLGWTETKLWTLKYGSKSIQTSLILRQSPPKPYKLLKFFLISLILFKMSKHSDFHLSFFQIVSAWRDLVLGDAVSKLETFVWILSHVSRSITWSLFTLKISYLVKWSISTWSFMWGCQFIDWLKFETRPSFLLNFGTAYRPFPCSLVPLFQNKCETFHTKMSSACSFIFMQIKVIFIRNVSHLDSLWNRGTRELGKGILSFQRRRSLPVFFFCH